MRMGYSWASTDPEVGGKGGGRCSCRGEQEEDLRDPISYKGV